jgi:hypothetical protein
MDHQKPENLAQKSIIDQVGFKIEGSERGGQMPIDFNSNHMALLQGKEPIQPEMSPLEWIIRNQKTKPEKPVQKSIVHQ